MKLTTTPNRITIRLDSDLDDNLEILHQGTGVTNLARTRS